MLGGVLSSALTGYCGRLGAPAETFFEKDDLPRSRADIPRGSMTCKRPGAAQVSWLDHWRIGCTNWWRIQAPDHLVSCTVWLAGLAHRSSDTEITSLCAALNGAKPDTA